LPLGGRKVEEREHQLSTSQQRGDGPRVLVLVFMDELFDLFLRALSRLRLVDLVELALCSGLKAFGRFVEPVRGVMHPAALLFAFRPDLSKCSPEAQGAISDGQHGWPRRATSSRVAKHREPAFLALPIAVLHRDQLLAAILAHADQNERAEPVVLETDPEVNPISPEVDESSRPDVAFAKRVIFLLPRRGESSDRRGRQSCRGFFAQQSRKRFTEISGLMASQIENREYFRDLGRSAHVGRQDLAGEATPPAVLIDSTVADSRCRDFHRAGPDREFPLAWPGLAITDNERMIVLVTIIAVSVEVAVDFNFTFAVQHPLRSGQAELVESAPRFLIVPFGMDLDYILHRWPQRPRLIGFQTEEYAACFRSSIHNFRL
jgi:hypothetical protein